MNAPTRPLPDAESLRHVRQSLPHDSGVKHVQGAAQYIDDIREPEGTLHVAVGQSPKARGRLISLDVSAVRAVPGVVAVLTAADIPGKNDVSPAFGDDPLFVDDRDQLSGPGALRRRRDGPRHRAPRRQERRDGDRIGDAEHHGRGCAGARRDRAAGLRLRPRRSGCGDRAGARAARRPVPRRRAGAFLSRRPGRAGDPGRGRRRPRLFLDPASHARCSMWWPACSTSPMPT